MMIYRPYALPAGATASLCFDVLRAAGLDPGTIGSPLEPIAPCRPFIGRAFTVRGMADRAIAADDSLVEWTRMLSATPHHAVLVIEPGDATRAFMGELSANALIQRHCPAAVVDGPCRDVAQIRAMGWPVFCRGVTPRDIVAAWRPVEMGMPVSIQGQVVTSDDLVIGDSDGLCVIAERHFATLSERLDTALTAENKVRAAILQGQDPHAAYLAFRKF